MSKGEKRCFEVILKRTMPAPLRRCKHEDSKCWDTVPEVHRDGAGFGEAHKGALRSRLEHVLTSRPRGGDVETTGNPERKLRGEERERYAAGGVSKKKKVVKRGGERILPIGRVSSIPPTRGSLTS